MTSFITAQYGADKNQILDPNSLDNHVVAMVNPLTGGLSLLAGSLKSSLPRGGVSEPYPMIGFSRRNPWSADIVPFGTTAINELTCAGASLASAVDTSVVFEGRPTTRVDVTGSPSSASIEVGVTSAVVDLSYEAQQVMSQGFSVAVKAPTIAPSGGTLASVMMYCGDSGYTNFFTLTATKYVDTSDGWRIFTAHPSDAGALATTGSPTVTGSKRCKLRLTVSGGTGLVQPGSIWLSKSVCAAQTKPKIVLTFDDGYAEWGSYLFPACIDRNLPVTGGIDYVVANTGGFLTSDQISTWANHASGLIEFSNHGGNNESYAGVGLSAYLARVDACDAFLAARGVPNASRKLHQFVQGSYGQDLIDALKARGYTSCRQVGAATGQMTRPLLARYDGTDASKFAIQIAANIQTGTSVSVISGYIDTARQVGGTVFLMGHKLQAAAGTIQYIAGYDATYGMSNLLDFIAQERDAGRVDVVKWSDYAASLTQGRSV